MINVSSTTENDDGRGRIYTSTRYLVCIIRETSKFVLEHDSWSCGIMVRIDPCHGSDPGSIPGSFGFYILPPKMIITQYCTWNEYTM